MESFQTFFIRQAFFIRLLILKRGVALRVSFPGTICGVSRPNVGATGSVDS
jgi:hypothetical protein